MSNSIVDAALLPIQAGLQVSHLHLRSTVVKHDKEQFIYTGSASYMMRLPEGEKSQMHQSHLIDAHDIHFDRLELLKVLVENEHIHACGAESTEI